MNGYYSTQNKTLKVSLKDAVMNGLAEDGGLYMPEKVLHLTDKFLSHLSSMTFTEIALQVSQNLLDDDVPTDALKAMVEKAINFDAPIKKVEEGLWALELFHGPTLSFKDFGARFMAQLFAYFTRNNVNRRYSTFADF